MDESYGLHYYHKAILVHPTFRGVHHNVFYEKAILHKFESLKHLLQ